MEADCEAAEHARGLCKRHYMRAWEARRPACSVADCVRPGYRRGLCSAHYQRLRNHGDVFGGGPTRRVRGTGLGRRFYEKRRDEQMRGAGAEVAKYARVLLADPCAYCSAPTEHIDHVVPFASGGRHEWDNTTGACQSCNLRKGAMPLLEFLGRLRDGR